MADKIDEVTAGEMEMEERKEPEFVRFNEGDAIEGILMIIDKGMITGKPIVRYTVRRADGSEVAFIGTNQINRKLRLEDLGHRVQIICTGEDPNVKRGDNCMKLFTIRVSKSRASGVSLPVRVEGDVIPEITDEDIPF
jgi:hypothetical protein